MISSDKAPVTVSSYQPKIILDPDYLPDFLFVSYNYDLNQKCGDRSCQDDLFGLNQTQKIN